MRRLVIKATRKGLSVNGELMDITEIYKKVYFMNVNNSVTLPDYYEKEGKDRIDKWFENRVSDEVFIGQMQSHMDKYNWRHHDKNGNQDLLKLIEYAERLIEKRKMMGYE